MKSPTLNTAVRFSVSVRPSLQFALRITALMFLIACEPQLTDDPIPHAQFPDISVDTSLPEYASLRSDGNYAYIDSGVRGIILYRDTGGVFIAYERTCSYHPAEACSTVDVHPSMLYMEDPCCGSTFSLVNGEPTGGPAWRPLLQYAVSSQGSVITIADRVKN